MIKLKAYNEVKIPVHSILSVTGDVMINGLWENVTDFKFTMDRHNGSTMSGFIYGKPMSINTQVSIDMNKAEVSLCGFDGLEKDIVDFGAVYVSNDATFYTSQQNHLYNVEFDAGYGFIMYHSHNGITETTEFSDFSECLYTMLKIAPISRWEIS